MATRAAKLALRGKALSDTGTEIGIVNNADATAITVDSNENVGIGTSSPATELQIGDYTDSAETITIATSENGTGRINFYDNNASEGASIRVTGASGGSKMTFANRWTSDSDKVTFDLSTGNVGIGTATPGNKLQVNASSAIADELILKLDGSGAGFNGANDANIKHGLVYELCSYSSSTGVVQRQAAKIEVQKVGSWNEAGGGNGTKADLVFSTNNGTIATPAMAERMRIKADGSLYTTNGSAHPTNNSQYRVFNAAGTSTVNTVVTVDIPSTAGSINGFISVSHSHQQTSYSSMAIYAVSSYGSYTGSAYSAYTVYSQVGGDVGGFSISRPTSNVFRVTFGTGSASYGKSWMVHAWGNL